jgi:uncharacterized protein DUF1259
LIACATPIEGGLRALRDNGIEVTALNSHMLVESASFFFMHFWANDDALKLVRRPKNEIRKSMRARFASDSELIR